MISLVELARRSKRNPQHLRRLARSRRIPAEKIGRDWHVPSNAAESIRSGRRGRPLSAANAWGLLALLSGEHPGWVDQRVRYRLNGYLENPDRLIGLLEASQPRALVHSLWLPADDMSRFGQEQGLVLSGLSAVEVSGFDLFYFEPVLDGYVDRRRLASLIKRYRPLDNVRVPNLWLRVPSHRWVLDRSRKASPAVVAADLLDHPDQRVSFAARDMVRRLVTVG